jgi:hypothetical protein
VPTEFGPDNAIPGCVTITGIWLGDAIEVQSQSPAGPPRRTHPDRVTPPCQRLGREEPDQDLDFVPGDLQTSGAAVTVMTFRPSSEQAALVVAASDIDAVGRVLLPQLPDRLCVVPSRWTRAQLDEVVARFRSHLTDWAPEIWGVAAADHARPSSKLSFSGHRRACGLGRHLPDGLLKLVPSLTPLPATRPTL